MEETLYSIDGQNLQVLWMYFDWQKKFKFYRLKKPQKLQDSMMNLKHTKSNGAFSLLCTLIDTTPFRFWHTKTQRKNEINLQMTNKE